MNVPSLSAFQFATRFAGSEDVRQYMRFRVWMRRRLALLYSPLAFVAYALWSARWLATWLMRALEAIEHIDFLSGHFPKAMAYVTSLPPSFFSVLGFIWLTVVLIFGDQMRVFLTGKISGQIGAAYFQRKANGFVVLVFVETVNPRKKQIINWRLEIEMERRRFFGSVERIPANAMLELKDSCATLTPRIAEPQIETKPWTLIDSDGRRVQIRESKDKGWILFGVEEPTGMAFSSVAKLTVILTDDKEKEYRFKRKVKTPGEGKMIEPTRAGGSAFR